MRRVPSFACIRQIIDEVFVALVGQCTVGEEAMHARRSGFGGTLALLDQR